MIPKGCKRLAEVDFPVATVSGHAAHEKSIRYGYPSTLHLWWARRPHAACRAILLALLLPDPCDDACPREFKKGARQLLSRVQGETGADDNALRLALLKFIGDVSNWELAKQPSYIEIARGLIQLAGGRDAALVVDPFAGGGTIPLEALRLGCEVFASDLNPVASFIQKIVLDHIPRLGPKGIEQLVEQGTELRRQVERDLAEFYPTDPDGSRPLAYFWARTVRCESPDCGAEIPLASSFWLSKKAGRTRALRLVIQRVKRLPPVINFELFRPGSGDSVPPATAQQGKACCPACNAVIAPKRFQTLMSEQQGGGDVIFDRSGNRVGGARLLAVAFASPNGRDYRLPTDHDYRSIAQAKKRLAAIVAENPGILPKEPINPIRPSPNARGLSAVTRYGAKAFNDLFNIRQRLSLVSFLLRLRELWESGDSAAKATAEILAAALGKRADYGSVGTRWHLTFEKATCTFSKQALSQTWDYVEPTAIGETSGSFGAGIETVINASRTLASFGGSPGQVQAANACLSPLPDATCDVWFTDPPYYDAIPYADLSDFFFVWLKRALPAHALWTDLESNGLTPKTAECVWNQTYIVDGKPKDGKFFEKCVAEAFSQGRRVLKEDGVGCVVFAHKTTEGWEALLSGLIQGGWCITASWPIATERAGRLQSQDSAALATSVHLICRPRLSDAEIGDWTDVLKELPRRVADWMERLQEEGVRGADLVFACIGPALEIFSRHTKVETAEGREVHLPEYLEKVWEVVGRTVLAQILGTAEAKARNGAAGAVEEDARLTALFLWTLQSTQGEEVAPSGESDDADVADDDDEDDNGKAKGGYSLIYDVVRRFAQPLGIHLPDWEGRIIEVKKGVVRLLGLRERAELLFGKGGAGAASERLTKSRGDTNQMLLFAEVAEEIPIKSRKKRGAAVAEAKPEASHVKREATTLDRVHAAMLFQAGGQANALRSLIKTEIERGPGFLRLANSLAALYPRGSEERRLVEAMLLAVPK